MTEKRKIWYKGKKGKLYNSFEVMYKLPEKTKKGLKKLVSFEED